MDLGLGSAGPYGAEGYIPTRQPLDRFGYSESYIGAYYRPHSSTGRKYERAPFGPER